MRPLSTFLVAAFWVFLLVNLSSASQHPRVELLDEQGNNVIEMAKKQGKTLVLNGATYYLGAPYSPKQTCGACHDYDAITRAYHFQIGATDMGDDWGERHPEFHYQYLRSSGQFGFW